MRCARRRLTAVMLLVSVAVALAACGGNGTSASSRSNARTGPERIVRAPKRMMAAAEPQSNGIIWTLAGQERSACTR